MIARIIAITGAPGSGKSTLAGFLAGELGYTLVTMHELVEHIDPASLANGDMADEQLMRLAFVQKMAQYHDTGLVLDGWPRTEAQALLTPPGAQVIYLRCSIDVARARLLRRGRPDDTPALVEKRILEQERRLAGDEKLGWAYRLAGWAGTVNTSQKTPDLIAQQVLAFIKGEKREAF